MKSFVHRTAIVAGLVLVVVVAMLQPASAAVRSISFIPSTAGGPPATLVEYTPPIESTGFCLPSPEVTVTMSVSETGLYRFSDARSSANIPAEYSPGTTVRPGVPPVGAISGIYGACSDFVLGGTHVPLRAGETYTVRLYASSLIDANAAFLISGPGEVTVNGIGPGPSAAEALAACRPGAAVPAGYTLLQGTAKSETLTGTSGKDLIRGLGGNDILRGLGGDDILCGGDGNDTLDGGDGRDVLLGENGRDSLSGGIGDDHLDGGAENDTLNGDAGNDVLLGGAGRDALYGGAGDDELRGGTDDDVHDGGAGFDTALDTQGKDVFRDVESRG